MQEGSSVLTYKGHLNGWDRCYVYDGVTTVTKSIDSPESDLRSALVKGDKVHATPYWRRIIQPVAVNGSLTVNSYNSNLAGGHCGSEFMDVVSGPVSVVMADRIPSPPTIDLDEEMIEYVRGAAETKALADARRSYNNIPLLFAERLKTLEMIRTRVLQLSRGVGKAQREALDKYRRTRRRDKPRVAKDIASIHLELLFGWLPVIGEVEGLIEQLGKDFTIDLTARGRMAQEWVVAGEKSKAVMVLSAGHGGGTFGLRTPYQYQPMTRYRYSARTSLRYTIESQTAQAFRDNGFNFFASVYDLVPLSFVAAFVSNVDHYLRSFDPMIGASYVTGSTGLWVEEESYIDFSGSSSYEHPWVLSTSGAGRIAITGKYIQRFVLPEPPGAVLQWQNRLTVAKVATGVALAAQRYIKPVKRLIAARPFRYRGPRPKYLPPIRYRKQ